MRVLSLLALLTAFLAVNAVRAEVEMGEGNNDPRPRRPGETKKDNESKDKKKDELQKFEGTIGCARCCFKTSQDCASAIKIDGKVFFLKAMSNANSKTKQIIENCAGKTTEQKVEIKAKVVEESGQKFYFVGELLMDQ